MTPSTADTPDPGARMIEQVGGWWWPGASRKAHFFGLDGRSLCGKWAYTGLPTTLPLAAGPGPDDCKACWQRNPPTELPTPDPVAQERTT